MEAGGLGKLPADVSLRVSRAGAGGGGGDEGKKVPPRGQQKGTLGVLRGPLIAV